MGTAYRIRGAMTEDLESVLALDRIVDTLPHWRLADYQVALASPDKPFLHSAARCLFVAERKTDASVVGFAVGKAAMIEVEVLAELESVGVTEEVRRLGVGRALCATVIEWSSRMGASEIELEVRSRSAGPIALYKGLGFVAVGRRASYYRGPVDDAVLMRLGLTSQAVPRKA